MVVDEPQCEMAPSSALLTDDESAHTWAASAFVREITACCRAAKAASLSGEADWDSLPREIRLGAEGVSAEQR